MFIIKKNLNKVEVIIIKEKLNSTQTSSKIKNQKIKLNKTSGIEETLIKITKYLNKKKP